MEVSNLLLKITGDADQARRELQQTAREVSDFDKESAEAELNVKASQAKAELKAITRELRSLDGATATPEVRAQITQALVQLKLLEREVAHIDRMDATVDVDVRRGALESATTAITGLGRTVASVVPSLGQAGGAAGTASSGFVSLGTQGAAAGGMFARLGPAAVIAGGLLAIVAAVATSVGGALVAMVASLGAAVLGLGALGIAFGGALAVAGAFGLAVANAMKGSGPLVTAVKNAVTGLGGAFREATSGGVRAFIGQLAPAIKTITPMVRSLKPAFTLFGQAAGQAVGMLARSFAGLGPQIGQLIRGASQLGGPIAQSIGALARIFLNIANAAMPFLVKGAQAVANALTGWASGTNNAARLREIIGGLVGHLGSWLRLGGAVASVVLAFFKTAAGPGKSLVDSLTRGAQALATWLSSTAGVAAVKKFFTDTLPLAIAFGQSIIGLIPPFMRFVQTVAPLLASLFENFSKFIGLIAPAVGPITTALMMIIAPLQTISGLFEQAAGGQVALSQAFATAWALIKTVVLGAVTAIGVVINRLVAVVTRVWNAIRSGAATAWTAIKTVISTAVRAVGTVIRTVWNAVKTTVTTIWNAIKTAATTVWNAIKTAVSTAVRATGTAVRAVWNAIKGAVTAVWNALKSAASATWNAMKSAIGAAVRAVASVVKSVWEGAKGVLSRIWNTIKDTASKVWEKIKTVIGDAIRGAVDAIKNLAGRFYDAGKALIEMLIGGIKAAAGKIKDAVLAPINAVKDLLPGSEPKDRSSPLAGLSKRGQAIMTNLAEGIRGSGAVVASQLSGELAVTRSVMAVPAAASAGGGGVTFGDTNIYPAGGSMDPIDALTRLQMELRLRGVRR